MNAWANTVLTDKGRSLLAKLTQGNTLYITRASTGAGFVNPDLLSAQTDVTYKKQNLTFKPVSYPETGKCAIVTTLKNDGLETGYTAVQVGIFAMDPGEGEILFLISQATDAESGTIIPSETEMAGYSSEWTFYLKYGQAESVQLTVDPSNTVSREEMETAIEIALDGFYPDGVRNSNYHWQGNLEFWYGFRGEFDAIDQKRAQVLYIVRDDDSDNPDLAPTIYIGDRKISGGDANPQAITSITLEASQWEGTEAPYTYEITGYDGKTVEVVEDVSMTMDQLAAIESAKIKSDPRSAENILYAFGEKPTIDVPVLLLVR